MLRDEIIDLSVYYEVIEQQYAKAVAELEHAKGIIEEFEREDYTDRTEEIHNGVKAAYNILVFGNKDGELEEDH
jgi:hypothetical protein